MKLQGLEIIWQICKKGRPCRCVIYIISCRQGVLYSLWPSDGIWRPRSVSTLDQVIAQYWLIISEVLWLSPGAISWVKIFILDMSWKMTNLISQPHFPSGQWVNSLGPSDAIWQHRSRSTLVQVMACCLMAPTHYLNQCWLIFSKVQWHSVEGNLTRDSSPFNH